MTRTCPIAANLLRQGITLGISSRGVGSLKESGGHNEVQDDFELICFDLVSSPSTPGSYLFKNEGEADTVDEKSVVPESKDGTGSSFQLEPNFLFISSLISALLSLVMYTDLANSINF